MLILMNIFIKESLDHFTNNGHNEIIKIIMIMVNIKNQDDNGDNNDHNKK
jgi:hypothetical protein